jgi:excisionase family DNA binding protein
VRPFLFLAMKNEPKHEIRLLDVHGAGRYLGISGWSVREMCWRGELPFCRVGRLIRLDVRDLESFVEASKTQIGNASNR